MVKVLFVCTGNVFRSMTAEKCLKDFVLKNNLGDIVVDSCGTGTFSQTPPVSTLVRLDFYWIDASSHRYKKIVESLIKKNDLIIAMNKNHQKYISDHFGIEVPLFYEVSDGEKKGVLDFEEFKSEVSELDINEKAKYFDEYGKFIVDSIYNSISNFVKNINKYI